MRSETRDRLMLGWGLLRLAGSVAGSLVTSGLNNRPSTFDIKLVHASELSDWSRFPRYQDVVGTSYRDYLRRSEQERARLDEVRSSRYGHPVLFVSHRWAARDHPDPDGRQLRRLRHLRDCFIIYDYCSFPQEPRSPDEEEQLQAILGGMNELIRNVVILPDPGYLTRGWCIYEYVAAALAESTVSDELQDPRLVSLRNWAATKPPTPRNPWRDSFESRQSNHINRMTLEAVNAILPALRDAEFTVESDRAIVTALLRDALKRKLPPRKEYHPPLSEWEYQNWTDEDLQAAFAEQLPIPKLNTQPIAHFDTDVPDNLDDAADRRYRVNTMRREGWWG
jgi:hypothetical protein